ncbi:hypothetical protein J7U46_20845 [Pelomonas sp. V22]|uniref:hypothetical protein n=1 Tax=Pelomonas sp. V22 TaxID=2822139 RepID=UPI0024A7B814|nr:hypothetical protein [Pelomonas sp. V22]MDI4635524.1 hypothetical protein [Pelomonas sp. V22]
MKFDNSTGLSLDWTSFNVEPAHDGEKYAFSRRRTPPCVVRLPNGHAICPLLYQTVLAAVLAATCTKKAGQPLKSWRFFGREMWSWLEHDEKCRIGCCLAAIARNPDSPLSLKTRGKGQTHRYIIKPECSAA